MPSRILDLHPSKTHSRVRVWLNELPEDCAYEVDLVLSHTLRAIGPPHRACCAAIEVAFPQLGHPSTYGLLGGSFTPHTSGILTLEVATSKGAGRHIDWAFPEQADFVQAGLHKSSAEYLLKRLALVEPGRILGPGILRFDHSAEGISSSPVFSAALALVLLELVAMGGDMELVSDNDFWEMLQRAFAQARPS